MIDPLLISSRKMEICRFKNSYSKLSKPINHRQAKIFSKSLTLLNFCLSVNWIPWKIYSSKLAETWVGLRSFRFDLLKFRRSGEGPGMFKTEVMKVNSNFIKMWPNLRNKMSCIYKTTETSLKTREVRCMKRVSMSCFLCGTCHDVKIRGIQYKS